MSVLYARAAAPIEVTLDGAPTGLVGTLTVAVYDTPSGATVTAPTTAGITEFPAGSGLYAAVVTAPATLGTFSVVWDNAGVHSRDTLIVNALGEPESAGSPGPHYFTIAELRAQDKVLQDAVKYPDEKLEEYRALAEEALEDACDVAFVPRTKTVQATASGSTVGLGINRVRGIASVTDYTGTVVDSATTYLSGGILVGTGPWSTRPLTIVVEHGYDHPPLRVKHAALLLAKNWVIDGPISDRMTSFNNDDGTFTMATPGRGGSNTGIPEVDAVINEYRANAYVA